MKEEQEQREHEEYLKLKEAFTVDEEGTHEAELSQDVCTFTLALATAITAYFQC